MKNKEINAKKILVTGGAGFIGSNLCESLLKNGAIVYSLDNFLTGKEDNLKTLLSNKNFTSITGDIRDFKVCQSATEDIDFVLHNAAIGSVPRSIENPIETNEINITGFLNILKSSVDNNVKRFIYAASSSTYGDSTYLPKEEDKIGNPLSPYALSKYTNELYASVFSKIYDIEVIGLRYFNVFGKRQSIDGPYSAVIPQFISKLINHESPLINGNGSFSRDFTHVDNVVKMNLLALSTKNKKAINQVYNTAIGEKTTINELFNQIKDSLIKYDNKISGVEAIYGGEREGDIPHSVASIKKAEKLLNYKPTINVEDGLKETVKWFYGNLKNK